MWMWEPASAMALSIFLTIALFLTAYAAAYLIVAGFFKTIKSIKKIINEKKELLAYYLPCLGVLPTFRL
jgi:hypothetical protein